MGGGDRDSDSDSDSGGEDMPLGFNPDEEYSVEENSSQSSSSPLGSFSFQRLQEKNEGVTMDGECGSVFEGSRIPPSYSGPQANHKRRRTACREVLESYDQLKDRSKSLEEGKRKILSYTPGGWMENVIDDKFASERAQVSYNSSAGDGTYFLQEYMIPRGSTSFCLYDSRGLSYDSYDSSITLKKWITEGVHHRELVIRPSDNLHLRNRMKCKAHGNGYDKPVVVVTHGDLLSLNDRARVRVHLGELLGIPPAKQIFDIPESHDEVTEFTIVNMLHYSLEHADKNLPHKRQIAKKARILSLYSYVSLFIILAIAIISICTPPLFIQHPPISKPHAYVPQSEALVDPHLSEALVNGDPRNSEARLDPPKSNVHADPPMSEAPVDVDPPKSESLLDTTKSEVDVDPHKSETHADPSKSKAHTDLPKSKGLANSHQSDEQIIDWSTVRHLWLDEG
ncbi:hypothetical protein OIU76_008435 [Salix suchowensis]|nr:hypothetical protein OIU76_008435 [Salix suchowensis]